MKRKMRLLFVWMLGLFVGHLLDTTIWERIERRTNVE